jgi:hypothetical protein
MVTVSPPMIASVAAALRAFGFLKFGTPVGHGLHPGQRGAAGGERPQNQRHKQQPGHMMNGVMPNPADSAAAASPVSTR